MPVVWGLSFLQRVFISVTVFLVIAIFVSTSLQQFCCSCTDSVVQNPSCSKDDFHKRNNDIQKRIDESPDGRECAVP